MDFPPIDEYQAEAIYAYNRATIVDFQHNTYLLSYSWPDEENHEPEPTWLHKEDEFMSCRFGPYFDEESGRVVVSANLFFTDDSTDEESDDEDLFTIPDRPDLKFSHELWDFAVLYK
ncbi:hypothetical protein M413DRAFT_404515 [Hebeloma cylindrosporum]|uniref:Uncharacterized protein n=1 Tax=Hebeloma cylindrosporum TaxID=76867 RepID=A0A0C3BRT5_HEBCY|nr:hypothetical protein M413DRAFT_404515 [Hebeloma cylindrosporum h7]